MRPLRGRGMSKRRGSPLGSRRPVPSTAQTTASGIAPQALRLRIAAVLVLFAAALVFGYARQAPAASVFAADPERPPAGDPRAALFDAADHLETRMAANGGGLGFTATQIQLLRPAPGGPELMLQPDRDHPDRVPTPVDQIVLGSLSGRGSAMPDSFYAEWFNGTDVNGFPAFDGDPAYTGLVTDGELWRMDERSEAAGLGWLAAPDIPGFGVDPASLREFPDLLRRLQNATYLGDDADGHHWQGTTDALWYPGAVAIDGAPFTAPSIGVELWLDGSNHLVGLFAVAQNINETTYQMLCINRIRFEYAPAPEVAIPTDPGLGS